MNRVSIFTVVALAIVLSGCHHTESTSSVTTSSPTPTAVTAQVAATPVTTASAPVAIPSASPSGTPVMTPNGMPLPNSIPITPPGAGKNKSANNYKDANGKSKQMPPAIWDRMTRPLTLEEINRLPPETRDMILKAQGRLPATPAPKK